MSAASDVRLATVALAGVSLVSSLTLLLLIARRMSLFKSRFPLLIHCIAPLCACDVLESGSLLAFVVPVLLGGSPPASATPHCITLAMAYHVSIIGTISYYFTVCLNVFYVLRMDSTAAIRARSRAQHVYVWFTTVVLTIAPLAAGQFGPVNDGDVGICWLTGNASAWRLTFWLPLVFYIGFAVYLLLFVARTRTLQSSSRRKVLRRMLHVCLVVIVIWTFPLLDRVFEASYGTEAAVPPAVRAAAWASRASLGLANTVVWAAPLLRLLPARDDAAAAAGGASAGRVSSSETGMGESLLTAPARSRSIEASSSSVGAAARLEAGSLGTRTTAGTSGRV